MLFNPQYSWTTYSKVPLTPQRINSDLMALDRITGRIEWLVFGVDAIEANDRRRRRPPFLSTDIKADAKKKKLARTTAGDRFRVPPRNE